jgi:HSP20 family molecular chaperone IbpA
MNSELDTPRYWIPKTNVFIAENGDLIIKADVSGLRAGEVEIVVENKRLVLKGVRRDLEADNSRQLLVNEIPAGRFESILEVPDGFDLMASSSAYLNGMLRIVVPAKAVRQN